MRGTDRRLVGAALLAVLVLGLLCVPAAVGRTVGGSGSAAVTLSPRPLAGQCVAPLASPDQLNTVVDVVPVGSCSTPHSAEILTVRTMDPADWPKRPGVEDANFTSGALNQNCNELAGKYLGWGTRSAQHRVAVSFFTRLTVSPEIDWAAGQRWYACEMFPGVLDFPISWQGTARNANNGTPPSPFAKCADEPGAPRVSCDRPHHSEQLTQTYGGSTPDAARCTVLARAVVGAADPTFGGRLAVVARSLGSGSACWVTTTSAQSLTGTLINHGAAPLPLG